MPYEVLVTIYYAIVYSHLLYGIEIYGNTHRRYLNKLMVGLLNNKLLRILHNVARNPPVVDLALAYTKILTHLPLLIFIYSAFLS